MDHASDGDHGESAVHNLIDLILFEGDGILAKTERVEAIVTRLVLPFDGLLESVAGETLPQDDEHEDLAHAAGGDEIVMCFDRKNVGEVGPREGPELLDNHAKGGKHTDATVLDLGCLEEADVDVIGYEKRVELEGGGETFQILWLQEERNALAHLHGGTRHGRPAGWCGARRDRNASEARGGDREDGGEGVHGELSVGGVRVNMRLRVRGEGEERVGRWVVGRWGEVGEVGGGGGKWLTSRAREPEWVDKGGDEGERYLGQEVWAGYSAAVFLR